MGMSSGEGDESGMMAEINVTPFVDVMLVLLIIFMVTTPMMTMGMNVNLPRTDAPTMDVPDELVVLSITEDGRYYINENELQFAELEPRLRVMKENKPDQQIFLKADGAVAYEKVARLMALCTKVGIQKMGRVTEPGAAD
jgi:biopolymer transport protein TolR